ncbi:MAG: helix-turn-helix domain-containing protein, partial [Bacillota bacterium]
IQTTDPIRVNYLGNMLYMMVSREIEQYHEAMMTKRKKMYLQSKINEQIQNYKKSSSEKVQIHQLENSLSAKVRAANVSESRTLLSELLSKIVYEEGNNIEILRIRAIEICSLLSRAAIDGGANEKKMLSFNYTLFSDLNKLKSIDDISYWLFKVLDYYINNIVIITHGYNSEIIKKAMTYINNHYKENINIEQVAGYVHLNHSYFSTLFKKETGQTFSEYLLKNRIEESKLLLANTDMGILDISLSVGLNSQSYFTKVFKKQTGITPNQYRKQNSVYY